MTAALADGAADDGCADDQALRHGGLGVGGGHDQARQYQPAGGPAMVQQGVEPGRDGAAPENPQGHQLHGAGGGGLGQKTEAGHGDHYPGGEAQKQAGPFAGVPVEEGGQGAPQAGAADARSGGHQQRGPQTHSRICHVNAISSLFLSML